MNMKNNPIPPAPQLPSLVKKMRHSDTLAFSETPSDNQFPAEPVTSTKNLAASELFSLFTADIIRQDVKFTR